MNYNGKGEQELILIPFHSLFRLNYFRICESTNQMYETGCMFISRKSVLILADVFNLTSAIFALLRKHMPLLLCKKTIILRFLLPYNPGYGSHSKVSKSE